MRDRAVELSARWLARRRLLPDDGSFLVVAAQKARDWTADRRRKSCLKLHPTAVSLADALLQLPRDKWRPALRLRRDELLCSAWDDDPRTERSITRAPGLTLRQIGLARDRALEAVLLKTAAGNVVGKPGACLRCRAAHATTAHLRSCRGCDFSSLLAEGDLLIAATGLARGPPALQRGALLRG